MLSLEIKSFLDQNLVTSAIIIAFVSYLYYYINNIKKFPRGPFPLPLLGNVLHFRGERNDPSPVFKMTEWAKKFGPVYTLWVGHKPIIVVNSYEMNCEASLVKRNDFIERSDNTIHRVVRSGSQNIFSQSGPYWEALRKVALVAVRKFAVSESLPQITAEVMDEAIDLMVKQKQPINPIQYIDFMIYNSLAVTAYGQKLGNIDDQIFQDAKEANDQFYEIAGNGFIGDFIPWLRPFYYQRELQFKKMMKKSIDITKEVFLEHKKSYTPGVVRDFSDCVLEAKEEAIREKFSRSQYLNDNNLYMVVSDLFVAGTDTTQTLLRWALLFLANDPVLQQQIFEEINEQIGDRIPTQDDRLSCSLTMAFIMEVLRLRPGSPLGVDHMTGVDTELGGHKIPKNTTVLFNLYAQNTDPKYWKEPLKFDPSRFLDSDGHFITGRLPSFVSFGLGRRNCPGEKLALYNAFLMMVRIVQKMSIELSTGAGSADIIPYNVLIGSFPKDYHIYCTLRE